MVFKPLLTKREISKIASEFRSVLENAGIKVQMLILFGSYARGRPHPWSDIDICVVSAQFGKRDFDEMVRITKLAKQVNYLLEAHPLNPLDLKEKLHPLAEEIKRTGKTI